MVDDIVVYVVDWCVDFDWCGCNIIILYKLVIMDYVVDLGGVCVLIGVMNMVLCDLMGVFMGINIDVVGFFVLIVKFLFVS